MKMKIEYDNYAKARYIRLQEKERGRTIEINENLNIDLDEKGNLIGVEILNPDEYPLEKLFKPVVEEYTEKDGELIEIKKSVQMYKALPDQKESISSFFKSWKVKP